MGPTELKVRDLELHPIARDELSKSPPFKWRSLEKLPQEIVDGALSVRRFQVVQDQKSGEYFVISHIRLFSQLKECAIDTKIEVEIVSGLRKGLIAKRVHADVSYAMIVDGLPIEALPALAAQLESEFPRSATRPQTMSGQEAVAHCFGVDIRRFRPKKRKKVKETAHPEGEAA